MNNELSSSACLDNWLSENMYGTHISQPLGPPITQDHPYLSQSSAALILVNPDAGLMQREQLFKLTVYAHKEPVGTITEPLLSTRI